MNHNLFQLVGFIGIRGAIETLSTNREFGHKFETTDIFWNKIEEIIKIFRPTYIATKEMQGVGHGLADFYISWLRIEKNLHRIIADGTMTNLATEYLKALEEHRAVLLETPYMLAAIYLDPRVKSKLNETQKECAILLLRKLFMRSKEINETPTESNNSPNNTLDELNAEFRNVNDESVDDPTGELMTAFTAYDAVKHVDLKSAVMDFWKNHKEEHDLIYPLACVIHSIPAGQCFEEQNFSSFGYIRNAKRTALGAKNVTNVLAVRLNKEIFYDLKTKHLNEIKNRK